MFRILFESAKQKKICQKLNDSPARKSRAATSLCLKCWSNRVGENRKLPFLDFGKRSSKIRLFKIRLVVVEFLESFDEDAKTLMRAKLMKRIEVGVIPQIRNFGANSSSHLSTRARARFGSFSCFSDRERQLSRKSRKLIFQSVPRTYFGFLRLRRIRSYHPKAAQRKQATTVELIDKPAGLSIRLSIDRRPITGIDACNRRRKS